MALAPEPRAYASPTVKGVKKAAAKSTAQPMTLEQQLAGLLGGPGVDTAAINRAALGLTNQTIAPQLAGYRQLQQDALRQSQQQAGQINQAARAAASLPFIAGMGDAVAGDYRNAVAAQAGLAQGFTGQLRDTAEADAAAAQRQAQAAGGSAGQVQNLGAPLGNLLYGLGGKIPADVLQAQGIGASAAARALPSSLLGYGQQSAIGALGAGREAAAGFVPEIQKVLASRPKVLQDYMSALTQAAQDDRQDRIGNAFKALGLVQDQKDAAALADYREGRLAVDKYTADQLGAYRNAQIQLDQQAQASLDAYRQGQLSLDQLQTDISRYNAQTARINAQTSRLGADTSGVSVYNTSDGLYAYNQGTGQLTRLPGQPQSGTKSGAPTTRNINGVTSMWNPSKKKWEPIKGIGRPNKPDQLSDSKLMDLRGGMARAFAGVPEHLDANGKTVAAVSPITYQEAIGWATRAGYSLRDATRMANRFYRPGVLGRPPKPLTAGGRAVVEAGTKALTSPAPFLTGG